MPFGLSTARTVLVGVVAAILVAFIVRAVTAPVPNAGALAAAHAQIAALRDEVALADQRTDVAESEIAQADAHVLQATHRADLSEMALSRLQQHFQVAASEAADTCGPVIAAADSALAAGDSALRAKDDQLTAVLQREFIAKTALDSARLAFKRIGERAARVDTVVAAAAHASVGWRVLIPRPGAGVAVGKAEDGKIHTVAGATLGWRF